MARYTPWASKRLHPKNEMGKARRNTVMIRAKTLDEYIDWVKQAVYEVEELRASIEFDEEFMGDALVFLDPLENEVKKLYRQLTEGNYEFSDEPLKFMPIVEQNNPTLLPFKPLLIRINATHTKGLNTGGA